jgi:tetratricopeptide (TPR) repeat protein
MGSKEEKLMEEARRLIARGQLDKALKSYELLLARDPSSMQLRHKMADLLLRMGRTEAARAEYETVGGYYADNGFYPKAIALYRQVQKLCPSDAAITLRLAELNERMGLVGNAMTEYRQAYDCYQREGNTGKALEILERMQRADRQDAGIRLQLAEAYFHAGQKDASYEQFLQLALLLQERGDSTACDELDLRIRRLFPEKTDYHQEVLARRIAGGNTPRVLGELQRLLRENPRERGLWELTVRAFEQLGQPDRLRAVYQRFLHFLPDEPSPKIGLITCAAAMDDLAGTLALLQQHEQAIAAAGAHDELLRIYRMLNVRHPLNRAVLEGLERTCAALGLSQEAAAAAATVASLRRPPDAPLAPEAPPSSTLAPYSADAADGTAGTGTDPSTDAAGPVAPLCPDEVTGEDIGHVVTDTRADAAHTSDDHAVDGTGSDDELEIEVEIDADLISAAIPSEETAAPRTHEEPFASLMDIFDMISVSSGGVRFANAPDGSDTRSHYDLGVAFKEMGLYDEAINEFRLASADTGRRMECLVMQAVCLRERGELETAEHLLNALARPGLPPEQLCSVKYELAMTLQTAGRRDEANRLLEEVDALDPVFRELHSHLQEMDEEQALPGSGDSQRGVNAGTGRLAESRRGA